MEFLTINLEKFGRDYSTVEKGPMFRDVDFARNQNNYSDGPGFKDYDGQIKDITLEPEYWETRFLAQLQYTANEFNNDYFVDEYFSIPANSGGNTTIVRRMDSLTPATTPLKDDTNSGSAQMLNADAQVVEANMFGSWMEGTDLSDKLSFIDWMSKNNEALSHQVAYTRDTLAREYAYADADKYYATQDDANSTPGTHQAFGSLKLADLEAITLKMEYQTKLRPDARLAQQGKDSEYLDPATMIADPAPRRPMASHGSKYGVLVGMSGMLQILEDERFQANAVLAKDYNPFATDMTRPNEVLQWGRLKIVVSRNPKLIEVKAGTGATTQYVEGKYNEDGTVNTFKYFGENLLGTGVTAGEVAMIFSDKAFAEVTMAGGSVEWIYKPFGSIGEDILNRRQAIGWKAWFGFATVVAGGTAALHYAIDVDFGTAGVPNVQTPKELFLVSKANEEEKLHIDGDAPAAAGSDSVETKSATSEAKKAKRNK